MIRIELVDDVVKQMRKDRFEILKIAKGKAKLPKFRKKICMTPKTFTKLFSPKRVNLLKAIRDKSPRSISDLARKTNRRFEAVHRDCAFLALNGLIKFREKNNAKIPVLCGKLSFSLV